MLGCMSFPCPLLRLQFLYQEKESAQMLDPELGYPYLKIPVERSGCLIRRHAASMHVVRGELRFVPLPVPHKSSCSCASPTQTQSSDDCQSSMLLRSEFLELSATSHPTCCTYRLPRSFALTPDSPKKYSKCLLKYQNENAVDSSAKLKAFTTRLWHSCHIEDTKKKGTTQAICLKTDMGIWLARSKQADKGPGSRFERCSGAQNRSDAQT